MTSNASPKKRGSDEQSTGKSQDKDFEIRQAKNILNDTLNKINNLEEKKVPESMDEGKSIPPKDSRTAEDIEKQYPTFFDEDSGNSDNKKQGYLELKEYIQEELDALPGTKQTSAVESPSIDRETKKNKNLQISLKLKKKLHPQTSLKQVKKTAL